MSNDTYDKIYKSAKERKLLSTKVKREQDRYNAEEAKFMIESSIKLAKVMGFKDVKSIDRKTKDIYVTFKMLLAFYRKITVLVELEKSGKIKVDG